MRVERTGPLAIGQYFEWWQAQEKDPRAHSVVHKAISYTPHESPTVDEMRSAFVAVLRRNESLRSLFDVDEHGEPRQRVLRVDDPAAIPVDILDPDDFDLDQAYQYFKAHSFDLDRELPFRAVLLVREGKVRALALCISHVAADGHAMEITLNELGEVLRARRAGEPPALPPAAAQPIDLARDEERRGAVTFGRTRICWYWRRQLATAPTRNFPARRLRDSDVYTGRISSYAGPSLLAQAALDNGTLPSVVYLATVHMMLHILSGNTATIVRMDYLGRDPANIRTVGCFHREPLTLLDFSARPGVTDVIKQATHALQQGIPNYAYRQTDLREWEAREEIRRGSAFTWGTIVNWFDVSDYARDWTKLAGTLPDAELSVTENPLGSSGPHYEDNGMECYLMMTPSPRSIQADVSLAAEYLDDTAMQVITEGPWQLLHEYLTCRAELTMEDAASIVGVDSYRPAAELVCSPVSPHEVARILLDHTDVLDCYVEVATATRGAEDVTAFVSTRNDSIGTAELRNHFLEAMRPCLPVVCPGRFVVTREAPSERTDRSAWRSLPPVAEGSGREAATRAPAGPAEEALHDAVCEALAVDHVEMSLCYLDAGGSLERVPHLVRLLAARGYPGLRVRQFESAVPLHRLARSLDGTGPHTASRVPSTW